MCMFDKSKAPRLANSHGSVINAKHSSKMKISKLQIEGSIVTFTISVSSDSTSDQTNKSEEIKILHAYQPLGLE